MGLESIPTRFIRTRFDTVAAAVLAIFCVVEWSPGLGPNGWWNDDAWVVSTVMYADSFGEFVNIGFTHPGFNALVWLVTGGEPGGKVLYQLLPFVAGVASIVMLFWVLRRSLGSALPAFLMCIVVADNWLVFRQAVAVKPYTIELLAMAIMLFALQRVKSLPSNFLWRWAIVLLPVAVISVRLVFVSICAAVGLWWAKKMTFKSLIALGAIHVLLIGPWMLFQRTRYDLAGLVEWWKVNEDTYVTWDRDAPITLVVQLKRATRVLVDGPSLLAYVLVALIAIGCIRAAFGRRPADSAALAAVAMAVAGSMLQVLPLGPERLAGERVDLWLVPAFLLLIASGMRGGYELLRDHVPALPTLDLDRVPALALATLALLVPFAVQTYDTPHVYPDADSEKNIRFALDQSTSHPNSLLVGGPGVVVQLAPVFPELVADIVHDPSHARGMRLELEPGVFSNASAIFQNRSIVDSYDRIVVLRIALSSERRDSLNSILRRAGFVERTSEYFELVSVWDRTAND